MPRARWVLLASLLFAIAARGEESAPAGVVRSFHVRLSGGDLAGARELWLPAGRREVERKYARLTRVRCMRVVSLGVDTVSMDGDAAVVDVDATIAEWEAGGGAERLVRLHGRVRLRRSSGAWRIEEWVEKEQQRADAIARAGTEEERQALLRDDGALDGVRLGEALTRHAVAFCNERRFDRAGAMNAIARAIAEEHRDDRLLARVIGIESVMARLERSDHAAAISLAEESLRLAERSGDPDAILVALLRLIRARREATPFAWLDALFARAMPLLDRVVDAAAAAHLATLAAWHYDNHKHHRQALVYSLMAERLAEESGDPVARLNAQLNLGGSYLYKLDLALAEARYQRVLALAEEAKLPIVRGGALVKLAGIRYGRGDYESVGPVIEEILQIAEAESSAALLVEGLLLRVDRSMVLGDLEAAEQDLDRGRAVAEQLHNEELLRRLRLARSGLRFRQRRFEDVLAVNDDQSTLRGRALRALGRHAEAEAEFRIEIDYHERSRTEIGVDPRQIRHYLSGNAAVASDELVDLLLECGRTEDAMAELERRKASVLRDVLVQGGATDPTVLDAREREQLQDVETRLERLNRKRSAPAVASELRSTRLELSDFWARMYATHPELRWSSVPAPPVEGLLSFPDDLAYVSYAVMEEKTIVFSVVQDGQGLPAVRGAIIPIARRELRERVRAFTQQIETRDLSFAANARALYDLLLRPVEQELFRPGRRICIIPDRDLWRLPFHALQPARASYVAERASVFYAPSMGIVHALAARGSGARNAPRLLALGNPHVPGAAMLAAAESEVRGIASLYPPKRRSVQLNGNAGEAALKAGIRGHDVIHVAAHALLDEAPMYSAVLLGASAGEDGRFEARELAAMKLDARVVVISACESARGDDSTGEGVVGLPWALLATGTRSSVVSLWDVDSRATATLMQTFHRRLLAARLASVSDALRAAQLSLLHSDAYSHPYYWAPFIAIGAD